MKVTAVLFSSLAFLGAVVAQDYNSLPQCGKNCISDLLNDAPNFGCTAGSSDEPNCLCANANFTYGIRDCSNESCGDSTLASSVIAYGISYCSSAGVAIPTTIETVTSGTVSPTVTGSGTGSSGAGGSSTGGSGSAISTSSYLTTVTTDGSTITTSAASTIFSSGASASSTGSGAGSSLSSIASSASSAASSLSSKASSAASGASSSASGSSSSSAFAPQMTAAPAGFLAAAGLAAMLL